MKTQSETQDMLDKTYTMQDFHGMTYKEGIQAALEWVLEMNDSDPTE
jgi:hypothetical protein